MKSSRKKKVLIVLLGIFTLVIVVYFSGVFGQVFINYTEWLNSDGLLGQSQIKRVNWNPLVCIPYAFTVNGLKSMLLIAVTSAIISGTSIVWLM